MTNLENKIICRQARKLFATKIIFGDDISLRQKIKKVPYLTPDLLKKNKRPSKFWKKDGNREIINRPGCSVGCLCVKCKSHQESSMLDSCASTVKRNLFNLW